MGRNLLKKLEETRQLMIESGMENGLQNPKTIRLSKKLDRLMNQIDDEPTLLENEQHHKYIQ
ncbi:MULTISPECIES: aspartyl-phosphate phosphatase Spo0E family protein [Lysinibacillus]|uniref:Aspartyl-phosphate phosphatase Spo0E family protein n=1 Tax=Lysinibacillus antri TaxID=2498145 RepID=A0A3S0PP89_9BACI|nr:MULTISPECIES: aspartyl-phosphate phosphatase Spo0E family protein [Lysinibacillus]RUL51850.1 aspartyl-phosphate phosphatase Spo0E family protein [Lysinibacillus antri]TSI04198.1 aspartyl-phosphate phosphatase Spo0E family protein [Lysinibacillus sp. BW-2-10]